MDYAAWIARRSRAWDELDARVAAAQTGRSRLSHDDLEQLALLYRRALHDHAVLTARFPGTGAAARVHRLVVRATTLLRGRPAERRRGLRHFLWVAFPRAFRAHLAELGVAAALFLLVAVAGLSAVVASPEIGSRVLGAEALDGLRDGRLWTERLLTTVPTSVSSSAIATNNLSVALTAWVGGAAAGLGSLWIVVVNGIHLGAIIGVCWHYGMAGALFDFVAAHGPLELTLIMVCAAAGLGVARALVVPGDWDRRDTVPEAARRSLVLVIGCLPWFVLLAGVETLVSPQPQLSTAWKVVVGASLLLGFFALAMRPVTEEETV